MQKKDGKYQFEKDHEATRAYFQDVINPGTMFFHDVVETYKYMLTYDYYTTNIKDLYTDEEINNVYAKAYSYKFRFPSFMSAFKFYNNYALKTNDKSTILERYEDRYAVIALTFAKGDYEKAIKFIHILMTQQYQPATPTTLNIGRARGGEMVSCFLLEVGDSLNDISKAIEISMQLSKIGGGVALNLSKIRAKGESIKGVANATKGVVGVMKLLDNAFRYADQQGQRQGSGAAYLNIFHADIQDFLDSKKISGDEDFRLKTLSIGVVIPDKFIELMREDKEAYIFYPHTVYEAYGEYLDELDISAMYDELVSNPAVRKDKINPRALFEQIAIVRSESGYPYIMFSDNVNKVHTNNHISNVKFSNLCSEILQASQVSTYTDYGDPDDIGLDISCNLGSLNARNLMKYGAGKGFEETVSLATDSLTYVSDHTDIKNAPAVNRANQEMSSIGLGVMNLHGFLAENEIHYESEEALEFADTFFMMINYYSLKRSMQLAMEHKPYDHFVGSTYHTGTYFDTYLYSEEEYYPRYLQTEHPKLAAMFRDFNIPTYEDWQWLKEKVMKHGVYHSYRLAIAPTGSISYVQSATASVMPIMERIEQRTYGDSKTYYPMPGITNDNWEYYKVAYEMDIYRIVDMIATIQQHVDQGISFTYFITDKYTTRDITKVDLYAHYKGIKTIYYARTEDTGQDDCLSCQV